MEHIEVVVIGAGVVGLAAALAIAKRMVEQDKVVAFIGTYLVTTTPAVTPYLEQVGVPMIGGPGGNEIEDHSPMVFNPQIGSDEALGHAIHLAVVSQSDKRKMAILYCREASSCDAQARRVRQFASLYGMQVVFEAQVSIAQPDYTGEVLAARGAGAKAILLAVDNHSAVRVATSAHRQGYNPVFAIQYSAHADEFLKQGGAEIEGFTVGGSALHWDHALNADFRAAYQAYVPGGRGYTSFALVSWNAGKLLERVAPTWPAIPGPADVIASLRALHGETLGGRIPPTTFKPGAPAGTYCGTTFTVKDGKFATFEGRDQWRCPPGYTPGA